MAHPYRLMAQKIAKAFIERSDHLSYKGKKRDDCALEFWCGAAVHAQHSGAPDAAEQYQYLATVGYMSVAVRGYMAIRELATDPVNDVAGGLGPNFDFDAPGIEGAM